LEEATVNSVPQRRPRPARRTTIRFTGPDGVTHQGDGAGYAAAVDTLLRHHPDGQAAGGEEVRWRLTPQGEAYVAGLRDGADGANGAQRGAGR
jgi:hypothetical protein